MIPRVAQLSGARQRTDGDKILQIPRRGGAGGLGDGDIILGAEPALKPVDSLPEHPGNHFVLTRVQLAADQIVEFRLGDVEIDAVIDKDGKIRKIISGFNPSDPDDLMKIVDSIK